MWNNFKLNMLKNTFIARASDGLILSETYDSITDTQGMQSSGKPL
jgi:hypothetical protein